MTLGEGDCQSVKRGLPAAAVVPDMLQRKINVDNFVQCNIFRMSAPWPELAPNGSSVSTSGRPGRERFHYG
jgi:hypothetical protein